LVAASAAVATTGGILELTLSHRRKKEFVTTALKPAQVLDLNTWKVGLPTTVEIKNPALETYSDDSFQAVNAVQFTAHCGDRAQPGSNYARSELREMNPDGSNASWSSTSGTHIMDLTQRITHLPIAKPALICGQIHNDTYLILVTLTGNVLSVRYKDSTAGTLDSNYQLGTAFDLKIVAYNGFVDVYYNGVHKVHQAMKQTGCYFKAGCYLQSNTTTGDAPTAYGQVEISRLIVSHS
jgi:poly(beta-D-mannuronate) lyase